MKKFKLSLLAAFICLSFFSFQATAMSTLPPVTANTEAPAQTVTTNAYLNRLTEIDAMDKSNMSSREKKALRKEVRSIKKSAQVSSSGIYISVGTLVLILILVIILL